MKRNTTGLAPLLLATLAGCPLGDADIGSDEQGEGESTTQGEGESETQGESESVGESDTTDTTDTTTQGDGDGDGDGSCVVETHAHPECGEPCPIAADLLVRCDDSEFAAPGLRVAPALEQDGVHLVMASSNFAWFGTLAPDASGALEQLPSGFVRRTISLAQDPVGGPHLAVDQTEAPGYEGGVVVRDAIAGSEELVFDNPEKYTSVLDFEFDTQGRAHLWILTDAPDERTAFVREGGQWSDSPAPVPGSSGWQRYGLTSADTPVAFDFDENPPGTWRLFADEGMGAYPLTSSFGPSYPGAYALAVPPTLPEPSNGAPYFFFAQDEPSLRIAYPTITPQGFDEVVVPDTATIEFQCLADYDGTPGTCPTSCEEVVDGLYGGMTSVARTTDGRVWVAYVITHFDQTHVYTETCDEEVGCWCNWDVTRDDSWGELVLGSLDVVGGQVVEVLRLDTRDPDMFGLFDDYRESPRGLDMRAFDDRLAIGLREHDHELDVPALRVWHVDTSLIP